MKLKSDFISLKGILITGILMIPLSSFSQSIFEDKQKETVVKNKIQSVTTWDYNFVDDKPEKTGQKTSLTKFDSRGNIIETVTYKLKDTLSYETYKYNKEGKRIDYQKKKGVKISYQKSSKYNENGDIVQEYGFDGASKFKNDYEYLSNGNLKQITYTSNDKITEKRVFEHPGNLTNITVQNATGAVISHLSLKYDDTRNLIEETIFDVKKKPLENKMYVYNANNQVIAEVKYRGDAFYYKLTYLYNTNNDLTNIDEENPNEGRFQKKIYSYDSKGNLLEMKWRRNPKEAFSTRNYSYDANDNCVQYITFYPATNFKVLTKLSFE